MGHYGRTPTTAQTCHCTAEVCHEYPIFCCRDFEWICPDEAVKGTFGYFTGCRRRLGQCNVFTILQACAILSNRGLSMM